MKAGGLRLLLSLYMMGHQNTPAKGAWRADQAEDGSLNMYYLQDNTGALSIQLVETTISVDRRGTAPSLQYKLQESVLLHGLLDEVEGIVFDGDANDNDRLFTLPPPKDQIQKARDNLLAKPV
mmetsp:Transcript_36798/g.85957  ORF Transcript_36798/g.85957 Transcript_36798/m.85957 type:complete len:123 (+) Transcript_36798:372-740(+)